MRCKLPTREQRQLCDEYDAVRERSIKLHSKLVHRIDKEMMDDVGQKIGLLRDGVLTFEHDSELDLFFDHCLHRCTADQPSIIAEYLAEPFEGDALDERIRHGLANARYTFFRLTEAVINTGVHARDLLLNEPLFIMDRGLSKSRGEAVLAARLRPMNGYSHTSGVLLPIDQAAVADMLILFRDPVQEAVAAGGMPPELQSAVSERVLEFAVRNGLTGHVQFR